MVTKFEKDDFKDFNSTEMMAHIRNKLGGGDGRKIKGKTAYLVSTSKKESDELKTQTWEGHTVLMKKFMSMHKVKANKKHGTNEPVITIRVRKIRIVMEFILVNKSCLQTRKTFELRC